MVTISRSGNLIDPFTMNDELVEFLVRKYPDIFEKSKNIEITINDGWYHVLDTLLEKLSEDVLLARKNYLITESSHDRSALQKALNELIIIDSIDHHYGELHVITKSTLSEKVQAYIQFAGAMSSKVCERCGKPGKLTSTVTGMYNVVLCEEHYPSVNLKFH